MSRNRFNGVLVVDKPEGLTSHDVVSRAKRVIRTKIGHAGTLDPLATGVLPLLLGNATRLMRFYQGCDKCYTVDIRLGTTTNTYDREGRIEETAPAPSLSDSEVEKAVGRFTGQISQLPPMFSAVKIDGERLYEAARRGETRPRKARSVRVHSIRVLRRLSDVWTLEISCSSGTYIRSLAHDLGQLIGCGAHVVSLKRLSVGPFHLSRAMPWDELSDRWTDFAIPMQQLLPQFQALDVGAAEFLRVRNGNPVPALKDCTTRYQKLFYEGKLIAVAELRGDILQPVVVFSKEVAAHDR